MAEEASGLPAGAPVVGRWLDALFTPEPPRTLWTLLDETLRLTLAQGWIWSRGYVDDDGAQALAEPDSGHADSGHADFAAMLDELVRMWRHTYDDLRSGFGVLNGTEPAGADLELVLVASADQLGPVRAGTAVEAHPFITRYDGTGWAIAAYKRMLPAPGWPPTWTDLPR